MAEHGEWNRKGATLSDVTAKKEYGVDQAFIVKGIRAGKLEYREGSIWGNPYLKVLRSQLEQYIAEVRGSNCLMDKKREAELRKIKQELLILKKRMKQLEARRLELEAEQQRRPNQALQKTRQKAGALLSATSRKYDNETENVNPIL